MNVKSIVTTIQKCKAVKPLIDGMITYNPEWASFGPIKNSDKTEDGRIFRGKSLGLGVGLHGDHAIVTGKAAGDDSVKRPTTKQEEMKKMMERLIQKMVSPQFMEKQTNIPPPTVFDGDRVRSTHDIEITKSYPEVYK